MKTKNFNLTTLINIKKMEDINIKKIKRTINRLESKKLEAMDAVAIEALKAGEALRKLILSLKKIKHLKPKYKQWQQPYKYHR